MPTRWIAVLVTAGLLLLAPDNRTDASTKSARGKSERPRQTSKSHGHNGAAAPVVRLKAKQACTPCAAQTARTTKGRASRKGKKIASIPCHPKDYVDPKIARRYKAALRDMKRAGIKPQITSVWRSSETQAQLRRCSLSSRCRRANPGLYRAMPAGKSMHEAGFAVDIAGIASGPRGAKRVTPKGRRIVAIMKRNGFKWRYGLSDPAHFEADPRKYGYRSPQQAIAKTQATCQVKLAKGKNRKRVNGRVNS